MRPVAVADTKAGTEDSAITGTVATNDSDVDDGAAADLQRSMPPVGGPDPQHRRQLQLRCLATPPISTWRGRDHRVVASYTVTDGHGASDTATLTITVTGTNDAPVAVADTNAGDRGQPIITGTVATNDSDVDDGARPELRAQCAGGAGLTLNADGSYSFDPAMPPTSTWRRARPPTWWPTTP